MLMVTDEPRRSTFASLPLTAIAADDAATEPGCLSPRTAASTHHRLVPEALSSLRTQLQPLTQSP